MPVPTITKLGSLLVFFLPMSGKAEPVSIEVFKKLNNEEQGRAIAQAPPEQKEELIKLEKHLWLLEAYQSEEGIKTVRERMVAETRGMWEIERPVFVQEQMWYGYAGQKISEGVTAGLQGRKLVMAEQKLMATQNAKIAVIRARQSVVHNLVFQLAPSPEALALNRKAKELADEMQQHVTSDGTTIIQPITHTEQARIDKRVDAILRVARTLPKLPAGQAEKEYEAFIEDKVSGLTGPMVRMFFPRSHLGTGRTRC